MLIILASVHPVDAPRLHAATEGHGLSRLYVGHSDGAPCHSCSCSSTSRRSRFGVRQVRLVEKAKGAYSRPFLSDFLRDVGTSNCHELVAGVERTINRRSVQELVCLPVFVVGMPILHRARIASDRSRFVMCREEN